MNTPKGVPASYPYEGYRVYKVFHKRLGRYMAILFSTEKQRSSLSWARYVYETHHRVKLTQDQTVDHIDNDRLNDTPHNLQILSRLTNIAKYVATQPPRQMVKVSCQRCGKESERRKGQTNQVPSRAHQGCFCSRHCAAKFYFERREAARALAA